MTPPRQTIKAILAATSTTHVRTQAARSPIDCADRKAGAACRSVTTSLGNAAGSTSTTGSIGSGSSGGAVGSAAVTGFHETPHLAQRTDRPGFMRSSGTSYSAAQLGQTICMETRYDAARIITGMHHDVAKEFL
jgi:hypothetical protein